MKTIHSSLLLLMLMAPEVCGVATAQTHAAVHWSGSWAASQQVPEPENALAPEDLHSATLRQIVHLSSGGAQLRVRISNKFGTQPLHIAAAHIALPLSPSGPAINSGTDRALLFGGRPDTTIPAGAEYFSDPLAYPTRPSSSVAISMYFDAPPQGETGHPGSHATSYILSGDHLKDPSLAGAKHLDHWFQLSGVDVAGSRPGNAIVALGDSITDGHGSTTNGNDRWVDDLAARLQGSERTRSLGVLNEGIGGNRLLLDKLGPNALARFDRDVLGQSGVKYVIVLEGINDLGTAMRQGEIPQVKNQELVRAIIDAYSQMIERAHAHGLLIFGATLTPDQKSSYYDPGPLAEQDRQSVNEWIREAGHFDGLIDFDKAVRDPQHPAQLLPAYDSGDHLHPSPDGYHAMANAIPLAMFR